MFFDKAGRVLLVKPTYKERWDIPGGYLEPNETPTQACLREIEEELSLCKQVGVLLAVDWAPTQTDGDKVLFVFDGGELSDDEVSGLRLSDQELSDYRFADQTLFSELLTDRLERRLTSALDAKRAGRTIYLEDGLPLL